MVGEDAPGLSKRRAGGVSEVGGMHPGTSNEH